MNFVGKFDAKLHVDGSGAHPDVHHHVDSISAHAPSDAIIVPDADLLFNGDFRRSGVDLILSRDDREWVVEDYFKGEKRVALASPDGAHLTGDIINALAGHVQYAQADGSASAGKVIGHVTKLVGTATAIRNGVSIILNHGDNVEKGDVVQSGSGSTLGVTFIDGTVFGLSANARMVLNEMIYDPNGSDNSTLISLVSGTISFVAGQTAKHGDMKIDTPVATMGIRGTAVLVEIDFDVPGQNGMPEGRFQVVMEPNGILGSYILYEKNTLAPIAIVDKAGQRVDVSNNHVSFSDSPLTPELQKLISEVFTLKFSTNPQTFTHFTDTLIPQETWLPVQFANGAPPVAVHVTIAPFVLLSASSSSAPAGSPIPHINQPPVVITADSSLAEHAGVTGSAGIDSTSGTISFADINLGDRPTATATFHSYTYQNALHQDISASARELADIQALEKIPAGRGASPGQ
ncbi:MAG TPA: FecR family protein, partial [Bradyrhizobium sp.]